MLLIPQVETAYSLVTLLDAPVTLNAGSVYRVTKLATEAVNVSHSLATYLAGYQSQSGLGGANATYTSRTDAGSWPDSTTQQMIMGMLFDQLDDGVSAFAYVFMG